MKCRMPWISQELPKLYLINNPNNGKMAPLTKKNKKFSNKKNKSLSFLFVQGLLNPNFTFLDEKL